MARTAAALPKGRRLTDFVSLGVLARQFPRETVDAALVESGRQSRRQRGLPAHLVVYLVLALGLDRRVSCREVLRWLLHGLSAAKGDEQPVHVAGAAAITQARARLGPAPLRLLHERLVRPIGKTSGTFYRKWRLVSLDGSTLDLADSPANTEHFGKPSGSGQNRSYPQVRLVSLVESGTHVLFATHFGPYRTGETTLARDVVKALDRSMLCLADRNFCGYPLWDKARSTGAELIWRVPQSHKLPVLKELADGSYLSELRPPRGQQGEKIRVRVVQYTLEGVEDAEPLYRVITTLLKPKAAPAAEVAALYHQRWEIENTLDEVKTHLRGAKAILRSQSPDLVEQELYGLLMAHYAIRAVMHDAARFGGRDPDQLSYVHAVNVIRRWLPDMAASPPPAADRGYTAG